MSKSSLSCVLHFSRNMYTLSLACMIVGKIILIINKLSTSRIRYRSYQIPFISNTVHIKYHSYQISFISNNVHISYCSYQNPFISDSVHICYRSYQCRWYRTCLCTTKLISTYGSLITYIKLLIYLAKILIAFHE